MVTQRGRRSGAEPPATPPRRAAKGKRRAPDADNAPTAEMPAVGENSEPLETAARAKQIPEAAVARLAVYLRVLSGLADQGATTVSSEELSANAGVNSAKLRKDLSYLGSYGTRGVGYEVRVLVSQIERILGLTRQHRVAVVGIGNLGHALANYGGFPGRGFPVEALFDLDPDLIGVPVGGLPVSHLDEIPQICSERQISIGIIATPPTAAQSVCDRLVAGGVQCILNFAPVVLQVPAHIEVRKVDLAVELQILSFHVARRADDALAVQGNTGLPEAGLPIDNGSGSSGGNGSNGSGNGHTDGGLGMVVRG
ncbi:MAG TPA: redox-sensing transcriptional repressor Rex [Amycolatopsis sp.]|nr:redox-sensing transcriptional repressor Rex [Amycolatopsis sp.]